MSNPYTPSTTSAHPMTRRTKLRRMGVLSCAMMQGVLMAAFGLIIGIIYALIGGLVLGAAGASGGMGGPGGSAGPSGAELAGMGAIGIVLALIGIPIFYGVLGFIAGAITALLYNMVAGWTGGIEMEFLDRDEARPY